MYAHRLDVVSTGCLGQPSEAEQLRPATTGADPPGPGTSVLKSHDVFVSHGAGCLHD
jgi:hypothetical protein